MYKNDTSVFHFVHYATTKDEAFPFFQQVVMNIQTDLSVSVTELRTHQGKEYLSWAFIAFLQEHTIDLWVIYSLYTTAE